MRRPPDKTFALAMAARDARARCQQAGTALERARHFAGGDAELLRLLDDAAGAADAMLVRVGALRSELAQRAMQQGYQEQASR